VVERRGRFENRSGGREQRREEREPVRRLPIPEEVTGQEIDPSVKQELMSLPKTLAEDVARNLVMVARLLDEDPEQAYAYSRVALRLASRVAAVREAAGFASYASARYAEALAEFRATRRMCGPGDQWAVMADCERGLGRPERALEMAGAPEVHKLDKAGQVEMRLVAAGARQDMGQAEAAVVTLQSSELASNAVHPWTARLRYAYADALLAVGRETEARDWFAKAAEADHSGSTDASDRLAQLDGVEFTDAFDEADDTDDDAPTPAEGADDEGASDAADEDRGDDVADEDEGDEPDASHEEDVKAADEGDEPAAAVPGDDDLTDEAEPSSFLDSPFREPRSGDGN
jgi:tetratricopeptide (TPR) repeat protein